MRIAVIGSGTATPTSAPYQTARTLGIELASREHTVVCGGRGGVMQAVCEGVQSAGGHSIAIVPGTTPAQATDAAETVIVTGMGNARNVLVVLNAVGVIAVGGHSGTLSELGHALDLERPVAGLDTHDCRSFDGFEAVDTPAAAVRSIEQRASDDRSLQFE